MGQVLQNGVIITKTSSTKAKGKKLMEGNIFWQETPWFKHDLLWDRELAPTNFWKIELFLESKELRNNTPSQTCLCDLLEKQYLEMFLVLKTIFCKLLQNLWETTYYEEWLLKVLSVVCIFLQIIQELKIFFLINTSERHLQVFFRWKLKVLI